MPHCGARSACNACAMLIRVGLTLIGRNMFSTWSFHVHPTGDIRKKRITRSQKSRLPRCLHANTLQPRVRGNVSEVEIYLKGIMADGLDDEWWLDPKEQGQRPEDKNEQIKTSNRKTDFGILDGELSEEPKKKKRKRLKITDKLAKTEDSPATSKDFNSWLDKCGSGKLCAVELEDLHLKESSLLCNPNLSHLSEYLNNAIPDWTSLKSESTEKNTCSVLVVTSSAKRAVDLNRDAQKFKGKCSSAKLFAKHMKLKDQISFLGKKKIDFAIGTPNRIGAVIGTGGLNTSKTRYLILDWNWRDVKKRRMIDLPELEKDLFALLKDHFLPLLENNQIKIGLY